MKLDFSGKLAAYLVTRGIKYGTDSTTVIHDLSELLTLVDYPESLNDYKSCCADVYLAANCLRLDEDGKNGISHSQLDRFINELWTRNQWLTT